MDGAVRPDIGTMAAPILVVGATGTIGGAVVRRLVDARQPVVAVAPDLDRLLQLRAELPAGSIVPIAGRVESNEDARVLAARLGDLGRPLAGVVVAFPHGRSASGTDRGRLLDRSDEEIDDMLRQTTLAQHALARHLIPMLADSGRNSRYVIVGGPGSETPWAGYGHRSVAMAATRMLARVLHDEACPLGVRVQLLSIDAPLRSDRPGLHECPEWPAAADVARRVVQLLDPAINGDTTEAVVTCIGQCVVPPSGGVPRPYGDVPTFLASLRNRST
jgi:NAD(P)-dependent dehydrogenase (short-subunit alcohol dehydrogenase family)